MSEELQDELEAINAIYGDGCLVKSSDDSNIYILTPPGQSSSLRIEFPPDYPDEPPTVIGTNSTGEHGKKGDAARELELFCQSLGAVYQPGAVCLFDAIEELTTLLQLHAPTEEEEDSEEEADNARRRRDARQPKDSVPIELLIPTPPWVVSDTFVELRSVFSARCAKVSSPDEAENFFQHILATDKRIRNASHNMTAWRIQGPNNTSFQDCDDDGETAAGGRLLHLMQLMDIWNVMVIVTRWWGGHKLGPRRFALINQAARDAFVKAGLVAEPPSKKKGGKG